MKVRIVMFAGCVCLFYKYDRVTESLRGCWSFVCRRLLKSEQSVHLKCWYVVQVLIEDSDIDSVCYSVGPHTQTFDKT